METEYVKGKPYFTANIKQLKPFPYLNKDESCDVLIIGGGINGAIANYYFTNSKIDCILIDKDKIGFKNTSAATALLEYQLDDFAADLTNYFTETELVEAYRIGISALKQIDDLILKIGNECDYFKRDTLIYTLTEGGVKDIEKEYKFRKENGFNVEYVDETTNPFTFKLKAGLIAKNGGAEFNPYKFTKQLIENRNKKYSRIYEKTEAFEIIKTENGFKVITNYGIEIKCKKVIISTGFNTEWFTQNKLCDKFVSYTITTNALKDFSWHNKMLLQDTLDPYHYIRLTPDDRIVVGGEDILFKQSIIKESDADKKYDELYDYLLKLFPELKNKAYVEYKFCGAFSATNNNLAVIGEFEKDMYACFGYGANGIIYCMYGANILLNLYNGKHDKFEKFFSPTRKLP